MAGRVGLDIIGAERGAFEEVWRVGLGSCDNLVGADDEYDIDIDEDAE